MWTFGEDDGAAGGSNQEFAIYDPPSQRWRDEYTIFGRQAGDVI
jgi:hypothetical protein